MSAKLTATPGTSFVATMVLESQTLKTGSVDDECPVESETTLVLCGRYVIGLDLLN